MEEKIITEKVKEVLKANLLEGYSKEVNCSYSIIQPSKQTYPFQFFFDTCMHVFILTAVGMPEIAKNNIESLFALQKDDGFVGHMLYWDKKKPPGLAAYFQHKPTLNLFKPHMTALIQPPLAAQAVNRIYYHLKDKNWLKMIVPKLIAYYKWLSINRDFNSNGLIGIISNLESGMDWKPSYDEVIGFDPGLANKWLELKYFWMGFKNFINNYNLKKIAKKNYFIVFDACINTIYIQNLETLAFLCKEIGEDGSEFKAIADKATKSLSDLMYDDEDAAFYDIYGKNNKKLKVKTPTIFFPVVLKSMDDKICEKVVRRHLFNDKEFRAPFPIPSVSKDERAFNPNQSHFIWRGPTWVVFNWFVYQTLYYKGYKEEAQILLESIKNLIEIGGFREYYNPFTGEGYGADEFTWSGLVVDMMNLEKYEQNKKQKEAHGS